MLGYHGYYTYYIHWASKFATSAIIGNKAAYHIHWLSKLATSANIRRSKTNPELKPLQKISRNNILDTHNAGKMLSKLINFSCLAHKSSTTCYCTRKYASEFCKDFLSPSASCRITSDRCLSTWSWDSRSRTDSGNEFEELVLAVVVSNSNTTSRQDFGVVSVSSI